MDEDDRIEVAVLTEKVRSIEAALETLVTKDEFAPVRLLVYGMTAMILTAVIGALLALVVGKV